MTAASTKTTMRFSCEMSTWDDVNIFEQRSCLYSKIIQFFMRKLISPFKREIKPFIITTFQTNNKKRLIHKQTTQSRSR